MRGSPPNRRRFLLGALGGIGGALSGCSLLHDPKPEVVLESVSVRNLDDEAHTIEAEVIRNETTIARKTVHVTAMKSERHPASGTLGVVADDLTSEPAVYELRTKLAQEGTWNVVSAKPRNSEQRVRYEIRITESGSLEVWSSFSPR